jgi:hypothetical protein
MCRPRSRGRRTEGMQCAVGGRWRRTPRSRDKARGGAGGGLSFFPSSFSLKALKPSV